MTQEQYAYWLTILMLVNIPPQIFLAHLFFRWRIYTRRRRLKAVFIFAGILTLGVVALRVISFAVPGDNDGFGFAPFVVGSILSYTVTVMFWLATRVMARRLYGKGIDIGSDDAKTSDLVGALIFELQQGTRKLR